MPSIGWSFRIPASRASFTIFLMIETPTFVLIICVAISVTYFVKYDEETQTTGLTAWSINAAREFFKGGKVNNREGKTVKVKWKLKSGDEDTVNFSKPDMDKMQADVGDLVYITDARKWLGGLKSFHSVYGEPHNEQGVVYINDEHTKQAQFVKDKFLSAEKEM